MLCNAITFTQHHSSWAAYTEMLPEEETRELSKVTCGCEYMMENCKQEGPAVIRSITELTVRMLLMGSMTVHRVLCKPHTEAVSCSAGYCPE